MTKTVTISIDIHIALFLARVIWELSERRSWLLPLRVSKKGELLIDVRFSVSLLQILVKSVSFHTWCGLFSEKSKDILYIIGSCCDWVSNDILCIVMK